MYVFFRGIGPEDFLEWDKKISWPPKISEKKLVTPQNFGKKFRGPPKFQKKISWPPKRAKPLQLIVLAHQWPLLILMKFNLKFLFQITHYQQHKCSKVNEFSSLTLYLDKTARYLAFLVAYGIMGLSNLVPDPNFQIRALNYQEPIPFRWLS